jgi:outer membrane protein OmpA-like peptidoglycan-associated protein
MKSYFLLSLIISLIGPIQLASQNLIPNAGFEYKNDCPAEEAHFADLAKGWANPTEGTPDYYHSCGESDYQTPRNQYGLKKPYHGDAYVGLNNRGNLREYIRIRLTKKLKKGVTYHVKMHVSASDKFSYSTSDLGFYFSNKFINQTTIGRLKGCEPQIINQVENIIPVNKWVEVSGEFIAQGGEKFVTIGSFSKKVVSENPSERKNSYLFIDNLSTIALKRPKSQLPSKGKLKTLKSIYFEHDKFVLNKESFNELNELVNLLKARKDVKIEILGHTDMSGDEEHNITLSKQRAAAVANYLVKKGISNERLTHKGLGSSMPVNLKETKDKQTLNRRVEFRVLN